MGKPRKNLGKTNPLTALRRALMYHRTRAETKPGVIVAEPAASTARQGANTGANLGANLPEYSVSELSFAIKRTLEGAYGYVRLKGEISGFRGAHSSGHCYFTLKDEKARIEAVIWRTTVQGLKVKPAEGLEVIATGRVTTYPGSSKYQIVIDALEPAGVGALMALSSSARSSWPPRACSTRPRSATCRSCRA